MNPTIRPLFNRDDVGAGTLHGGLHFDDLFRYGIHSWRNAATDDERRDILSSFNRIILKRASLHDCGIQITDEHTVFHHPGFYPHVVTVVSGMTVRQWREAMRRRWHGVTEGEIIDSLLSLKRFYDAFWNVNYRFLTGQMDAPAYNQLMFRMERGEVDGYVSE